MKKLHVVALAIVITMASCMLFSCGTKGAESKDILRDDVKQVYQIDDECEKLVADMFETFDNEFNKIVEMKSISENDLFQYANNVSEAFSSFLNSFSETYEPDLGSYEGEEKDDAVEIVTNYDNLLLNSLDLIRVIWNYRFANTGSGEVCFESAVNLVVECSEFFYGTDRITNEDLDKLADNLQ